MGLVAQGSPQILPETGPTLLVVRGAPLEGSSYEAPRYHGWPLTLRGSCSPSAELHPLQARNGEATHQARSGSHPLTPLDIDRHFCAACLMTTDSDPAQEPRS